MLIYVLMSEAVCFPNPYTVVCMQEFFYFKLLRPNKKQLDDKRQLVLTESGC